MSTILEPSTLTIPRDEPKYSIDPHHVPVVRVGSGTELVVETHDSRAGRLRHPEDVNAVAPDYTERFPKTVPVTGPIFIQGAQPGDAITVEILTIDLDPVGYMIVKPARGLVHGQVAEDTAKILEVANGAVHFDDLRIPLRAMVGVLATAPLGEAIATVQNGPHGGNLDCNRIAVGSRVHMPVRRPGGLLYFGDVHASMGDGEACGNGVEIGARITCRLSVLKGGARTWPWIETEAQLISIATAPTYDAAAELAVREMMSLLCERFSITPVDAYLLVSAAGDIRVNQSCRYPIDVSVRVEFPKLANA